MEEDSGGKDFAGIPFPRVVFPTYGLIQIRLGCRKERDFLANFDFTDPLPAWAKTKVSEKVLYGQ